MSEDLMAKEHAPSERRSTGTGYAVIGVWRGARAEVVGSGRLLGDP